MKFGKRQLEISNVLPDLEADDVRQAFGGANAMKSRPGMTLFSMMPGIDKVFQLVPDKFFNGRKNDQTLHLLGL